MSKLVGEPRAVVRDLVSALVRGDDRLACLDRHTVIMRADADDLRRSGRVALISGGGSGHEPAHAGYVGRGMLTAAVLGEVFASPGVDAILAAIRAVTGAAGCLLIVKNYTGDRLNFGLAARIAQADGLAVDMVLVADDVALGGETRVGARGLAGTVLVHKAAGALAEQGATLAEVRDLAQRVAQGIGTMGVALSPCTVPGSDRPNFDLPPGEVEFGLGIHGEPGVARQPMTSVSDLVDRLVDRIVERTQLRANSGGLVALVNGLGATPAMELHLAAGALIDALDRRGMALSRLATGEFLGALDMQGISISLLDATPDITALLDAPAQAPAWTGLGRPGAAMIVATPDSVRAVADAGPRVGADQSASFRRGLEAVIACLIAAEQELTELDRLAGDGDLGTSLQRGAEAIRDELPDLPFDHPKAALERMADIVRRSVGGTSGPLLSAFLLGIAAPLAHSDHAIGMAQVSVALRAGCDAIASLGGAQRGDCTMLDALWPASDALEEATGASVAEALALAAAAAASGADATRALQAQLGRASYLGERVIGVPDPGAVAVARWIAALAETFSS